MKNQRFLFQKFGHVIKYAEGCCQDSDIYFLGELGNIS